MKKFRSSDMKAVFQQQQSVTISSISTISLQVNNKINLGEITFSDKTWTTYDIKENKITRSTLETFLRDNNFELYNTRRYSFYNFRVFLNEDIIYVSSEPPGTDRASKTTCFLYSADADLQYVDSVMFSTEIFNYENDDKNKFKYLKFY